MTGPTEYIESRKTALYQYIGTYGMGAKKLDTETTSYRSLLRLFKPYEKVTMRTADNLYQMARKITGITIPVKGPKYDEWFNKLFTEFFDKCERYRASKQLHKTDIGNITGIHRESYDKIRAGNKSIKGETLYEYYMNLKTYEKLRNRKCA